MDQRRWKDRHKGKRPAETGFRFLELTLIPQQGAQIVMCPGAVWLQRQCAANAGFPFLKRFLSTKGRAQIVEGLGIVRLQDKRLAITRHGLVQPAPFKQYNAEIIVCVGEAGLKAQCLAIAGLRLFQFCLSVKHIS